MHYQWYPGHMAKAKRMMLEDIKLIDVVIELVDARIPYSSKNPDIDTLAKNKSRVILLNKCDMADQRYNNAWKDFFESKGYFVALVNSKSGAGVKQVQEVVNKACEAKIARDRRKGILNRPVRAMIVGVPNVGKSTFINSFVGKASTKTGNKPGVTKGKQWIRINKFIELLDTPGILWPKFEDQAVGLRLALIGSINDNILNTTDLALDMVLLLKKHYPEVLTTRYGIEIPEVVDNLMGASKILEQIAIARSCLIKGGEPDIDRAGNLLIDDFRSVKLGHITLEFPSAFTKDSKKNIAKYAKAVGLIEDTTEIVQNVDTEEIVTSELIGLEEVNEIDEVNELEKVNELEDVNKFE